MALTLSVVESVYNTTTTPKTAVVASCVTGDYLFALAGGDASAGNGVTAVTFSTTAGTTGSWTKPVESLSSASDDWVSTGWAQVTADGSVTVSVDRTKAGSQGGMWGFYVVRAQGSSGLGNTGSSLTSSTTQTATLNVSGTNSGVAFLSGDWDAGAVGTAWTPATNVTLVERSALTDWTVHAAYWTGQASGSRAYGGSGGGGTKYRCVALEILESGGGASVTQQKTTPRNRARINRSYFW